MITEKDLAKIDKRISDVSERLRSALQGSGVVVNNGNRVILDISESLSNLAKKSHSHTEYASASHTHPDVVATSKTVPSVDYDENVKSIRNGEKTYNDMPDVLDIKLCAGEGIVKSVRDPIQYTVPAGVADVAALRALV